MMYYMYYHTSNYCEVTSNKIKIYPQLDKDNKPIKIKDPK